MLLSLKAVMENVYTDMSANLNQCAADSNRMAAQRHVIICPNHGIWS